jgi:hypothetical protein
LKLKYYFKFKFVINTRGVRRPDSYISFYVYNGV